MATLAQAHSVPIARSPLKTAGWMLIVTSALFVLYLVLAVTWGADYERDINDVAEATNTTINTIPASEMARISQRYETYSTLTGLLLFIPVATFFYALASVRRALPDETGRTLADTGVWAAGLAATVWYFYMALNVGLIADPDNLPPLTRDLDVLTVPLVAISAALSLVALIAGSLALRQAGLIRKTATVTAALSTILLLIGALMVLGSSFYETIPPPIFVPAALILAVGLLRAKTPTEHAART